MQNTLVKIPIIIILFHFIYLFIYLFIIIIIIIIIIFFFGGGGGGGAIDIDLQGQIWLKKSNFLASALLEVHNHHITNREPRVPRLLHSLTISWSPSSACIYVPRLFDGPDCFTVSTLCTYTDLGTRGYFGV